MRTPSAARRPCMVQLQDGSLLVSSYAWMLLPQEGVSQAAAEPRWQVYGWPFTFLGGYLVRSTDGGRSWQGPIVPPEGADQAHYFPGVPVPACNRGAMVQASDGNLYWLVQPGLQARPQHTVLGLQVSGDGGLTWEDRGIAVADEQVIFNETSLIETPRGDLVAFIRTDRFEDHGAVARSSDRGKTWEPWHDMGVVGHPYHAVRLPDQRVFLVYGYRHPPYGIRARLLDPECRDFAGPELVLRDDGGTTDLGYPWACVLADGRILATYYFNQANGTRHIAGDLRAGRLNLYRSRSRARWRSSPAAPAPLGYDMADALADAGADLVIPSCALASAEAAAADDTDYTAFSCRLREQEPLPSVPPNCHSERVCS